MTSSDHTPSDDDSPLRWDSTMRADWRSVTRARLRKNVFLALAVAPYLFSAGMLALGAPGRTEDDRAMMAVGGGVLLLFLVVSPWWLFASLYEWWRARNVFKGRRQFFKNRHGVDPLDVYPPA